MTKYKRAFIDEMVAWVAENGLMDYGGATFTELCKYFDIDDVTFYNWMGKSEFSEKIEKAKEVYKSNLQRKIEISLAKSATGYEVEDTQTKLIPDDDGKPTVREQVKTKKHVPANVAAGIFLLTNLDTTKWQNKQRSDVAFKNVTEKRETREQIEQELKELRDLATIDKKSEEDTTD